MVPRSWLHHLWGQFVIQRIVLEQSAQKPPAYRAGPLQSSAQCRLPLTRYTVLWLWYTAPDHRRLESRTVVRRQAADALGCAFSRPFFVRPTSFSSNAPHLVLLNGEPAAQRAGKPSRMVPAIWPKIHNCGLPCLPYVFHLACPVKTPLCQNGPICCKLKRPSRTASPVFSRPHILYHESIKKQDTKLLPITSPNVDWFSKFFDRQAQW